jgi:hypothetical protein
MSPSASLSWQWSPSSFSPLFVTLVPTSAVLLRGQMSAVASPKVSSRVTNHSGASSESALHTSMDNTQLVARGQPLDNTKTTRSFSRVGVYQANPTTLAMRRLLVVLLAVVVLTTLCGVILVPAVQTRSATTEPCDGGSLCGAEPVSLSCLVLGFGETYTAFPGYGYQFVALGC